MKTYTLGTQVRMTATFKDENGQLVDPSVVTCRVRILKTEETVEPAVTRQSLGVYRAWYTPDLSGQFQYRFAGTGTVIVAGEGRFAVTTSFPQGG